MQSTDTEYRHREGDRDGEHVRISRTVNEKRRGWEGDRDEINVVSMREEERERVV